MRKLPSRRNRVTLREDGAVEKRFSDHADFLRESEVYALLQKAGVPCAEVLRRGDDALTLSLLPGETMLAALERQESSGFESAPWAALADWLTLLHERTGLVCEDPNLRNFLYDAATGTCIGVDFEQCAPGQLCDAGAALCAYVLLYDPIDTLVKRQAAALLQGRLGVKSDAVASARQAILRRRERNRHD